MLDQIQSIVIVTYNSARDIERCLTRIYSDESIQIIVVDNDSSDNTLSIVSSRFPRVEVIKNSKNLGFAAANNIGIAKCRTEAILLLNPDAFVEHVSDLEDLRERLIASDDVAFVGPQLINTDGSHQVGDAGWRDNIVSVIGHSLFLHKLFGFLPSTYISNARLLRQTCVEVDWICGACLLTRQSVVKRIGGLSEEIFMYGEDVEWGERARDAGLRVLYVPEIRVLHLQGAVAADGSIKVSDRWYKERAKKFRRQGHARFMFFRCITLIGLGLRFFVRTVVLIFQPRSVQIIRFKTSLAMLLSVWRADV